MNNAAAVSFGFFLVLLEPSEALAGRASDLIAALPEGEVRHAMSQLLAGEKCGEVERVFFKGDNVKDDSAYYVVRCLSGDDYMISIKNSGNMATRITSCAVLRLVDVECWKPF